MKKFIAVVDAFFVMSTIVNKIKFLDLDIVSDKLKFRSFSLIIEMYSVSKIIYTYKNRYFGVILKNY